jgi:hypothetical protein
VTAPTLSAPSTTLYGIHPTEAGKLFTAARPGSAGADRVARLEHHRDLEAKVGTPFWKRRNAFAMTSATFTAAVPAIAATRTDRR